jgi:chromosome segregation ATPase
MSDELKNEEKTEETQVDGAEPKWDKFQQQLDQERANTRKLSQDREQLSMKLGEMSAKVETLQRAISDSKTQAQEVKDLDPNSADIPELTKHNNWLRQQLRETQESVKKLAGLATEFQGREQQRALEDMRAKTIEKILKPLDEEFGAKYRTTAKKLADKLVDSGEEQQPADTYEASLLMRKCYKRVVDGEKVPTKEKKSPTTDSGSGGGVSIRNTDSIGTGRLDDILAKAKKAGGLKALLGKT